MVREWFSTSARPLAFSFRYSWKTSKCSRAIGSSTSSSAPATWSMTFSSARSRRFAEPASLSFTTAVSSAASSWNAISDLPAAQCTSAWRYSASTRSGFGFSPGASGGTGAAGAASTPRVTVAPGIPGTGRRACGGTAPGAHGSEVLKSTPVQGSSDPCAGADGDAGAGGGAAFGGGGGGGASTGRSPVLPDGEPPEDCMPLGTAGVRPRAAPAAAARPSAIAAAHAESLPQQRGPRPYNPPDALPLIGKPPVVAAAPAHRPLDQPGLPAKIPRFKRHLE